MSKLNLRQYAIDLDEAEVFEPAPMDFTLPGFMRDSVGLLISPGGTGKSFFALEVACAIAGGDSANLLGLSVGNTGPAVYITAEDERQILLTRTHAISKRVGPDAWARVKENMTCISVSKKRLDVLTEQTQDAIIDVANGARIIIIDTLRRVHTCDENSNGNMAELLNALEFVAEETGAAVLVPHHSNKSMITQGRGSEQHSARGASVLVDNARWVGYLSSVTNADNPLSYVRFGVSKLNYAKPLNPVLLRRAEGGVLVAAENQNALSPSIKQKPQLTAVRRAM